ncbi:fluoride efflux transporter FluC [Trueperella sp. LYQ143]|uniref:fluoride efflux transporter FluC n=1 Tax=unclassified Trueperella TaxID=2630174 RepID=UPI00398323AF
MRSPIGKWDLVMIPDWVMAVSSIAGAVCGAVARAVTESYIASRKDNKGGSHTQVATRVAELERCEGQAASELTVFAGESTASVATYCATVPSPAQKSAPCSGRGIATRRERSLIPIGKKYWPASWPVATFVVNLLGSFILGLVTGLALAESGSTVQLVMSYALVGFTGGYSTYSTAMVDACRPFITHAHHNWRMERQISLWKHAISAAVHICIMAMGCCLLLFVGLHCGYAIAR